MHLFAWKSLKCGTLLTERLIKAWCMVFYWEQLKSSQWQMKVTAFQPIRGYSMLGGSGWKYSCCFHCALVMGKNDKVWLWIILITYRLSRLRRYARDILSIHSGMGMGNPIFGRYQNESEFRKFYLKRDE